MKPVALPKTRRQFSVDRDENGVPHITGATWLDVLAGLGFMHAMDRGTQMFFSRSVASGRAAEQIVDKPEFLETDRFFRRIGLHRRLLDEVRSLDDRIFSQLTAYCEGVNDGMKSMGRSFPMWAVNFTIEPWDQQAIILIGKLLSFGGLAISQMQSERLLIELIHAGVNEALLRELFAPRLDGVDFEIIRHIRMSNQLSDEAMELLIDLPRLAGSNAWVVAPGRTATGTALLASDPHLEVNRLPAVWYEAVLRWGDGKDRYVMGATMPGCPFFAVGRTQHVAWGVTYLKGDTIDYYIEDVRRSQQGGWQYRRGEQWHDFEVREEAVGRKGNSPEVLNFYESSQGVLEGEPDELGEGYQLALLWAGNCPGQAASVSTWLNLVHVETTHEAIEVARSCATPTLVWVFADRAGHIGSQACGRFPVRGNGQVGLAPIPAWDEGNHWQGWVDATHLPTQYDPEDGYIASANEELNPGGLPLLVTQPVPDYRKRRIVERLREMTSATLEEMQQLQYDLVSIQARELLSVFLPHLPDGPIKERLSRWDFRYTPDSREASLFHRLYIHVMVELLGTEAGIGWRRMIYLATRVGYSMMIVHTADRMLLRSGQLPSHFGALGEVIRRAAERIEKDPKSDVPWSELNNFHFVDRYFGGRQVGRLLGYDSRRYPMPGNHATPFQGHVLQTATRESTFAPSYHFVTDLGTDEAWTNLPGGPSESRFSKWYKSDIQRWFVAEYKKLAPQVENRALAVSGD